MSWLRYPRTAAEKRANQDGYCRPSRRPHRLPSSWDDILNWSGYDRTWKRHRPTQYKPVTILS